MSDLTLHEPEHLFAPVVWSPAGRLLDDYALVAERIRQTAAIMASDLGSTLRYFREGNTNPDRRHGDEYVRSMFDLDGAMAAAASGRNGSPLSVSTLTFLRKQHDHRSPEHPIARHDQRPETRRPGIRTQAPRAARENLAASQRRSCGQDPALGPCYARPLWPVPPAWRDAEPSLLVPGSGRSRARQADAQLRGGTVAAVRDEARTRVGCMRWIQTPMSAYG